MFERIRRRAAAAFLLAAILHASSAVPQQTLFAQTAPPSNGVATISPTTFDFGGVEIETTTAAAQFTLTNTGTGPLGSIVVATTNPDYVISATTCTTTLAVSASCSISVTFTPSFYAPDPGAVSVTDDAATNTTLALMTGTGVNTVYTLPFEMHYDAQPLGSTSAPQTATLSNVSGGSVTISAPTTVGNAPNDFTLAQDCDLTVPSPGTCAVTVKFAPTAAGPRTADLTFASDGGPYVNHLTGNGAIRHLPGFAANILAPNDDGSTENPVPLPFALNFFGTTYNSLYVNNNGNVTFGQSLSDFTPSGLNTDNGGVPIIAAYWADVDTSGALFAVPPSGVVTYGVDTVNGHPAFGVTYENVGYYSSEDDKLNSFQLILIDRSDTGIAGAFDIEFDYDKIQWEVGDASGGVDGLCGTLPLDTCTPAAVGYSNGTGAAGTNFQLNGSFVAGALLDSGPAATSLIQTGASSGTPGRQMFQVRNGAVQSADMSLTMTQSANSVPAGSNQTYTLTATNGGPNDATNVTITDTLPTNATLVSATPSQGTACTGTTILTCNLGSVANGASATLTITVQVNAGTAGATLANSASVTADQLDPNTQNNTASVTATITAATTPTLTFTPTSLTFASQTVNTTSASQNLAVKNTGTSTVTFTAIATSAQFAGATLAQCPTLAAGATCTFAITFTPTATGAQTGTIQFTDNATGSPQTVNLAGTGAAATAPTLTFTPTSLRFASQTVNTTSASQNLAVKNTGTSAVTFTAITTSAQFAGATLAQCPTLAVGATCTFAITFTPTATGAQTGTIQFTDNATGTPQTVNLAGTGAAATAPTLTFTPTSLTFASQTVNTTSASQNLAVKNTGTSTVTFTAITTSAQFAGATLAQCPTLAAGATCTFAITFTPTATGAQTGTIQFTDNATGSPQTVNLSGTGASATPTLTLSPGSLTFPAQALNTTSAPQSVTVTNTGTSAVTFTGISISQEGSTFALGSGTCTPTGTLAASASCTIAVTFTPAANGTVTATLSISDNATGSPQSVALTGVGGASAITISVPPGGSTTATSVPGGTAYYGLVISAGSGVSGTVTLGCTPSSPLLTCNVIPSTVTLNGGKTEVAFQIQTYCQGATTANGFGIPIGGAGGVGLNGLGGAAARWIWMSFALLFGFAAIGMWQLGDPRRNRRVALALATLVLVALGSAACGGGLAKGPNGATPAGTYTLSLSTTFNGQTQTIPNYLTLIVQ